MKFISILLIFLCYNLIGQELYIKYNPELSQKDSLYFSVKNNSDISVWFNPNGLTNITIRDSNNFKVNQPLKIEHIKTFSKQFFLIEKNQTINIGLDPNSFLSQFDLNKNSNYFIEISYSNRTTKDNTNIKTFTSDCIKILPFQLENHFIP